MPKTHLLCNMSVTSTLAHASHLRDMFQLLIAEQIEVHVVLVKLLVVGPLSYVSISVVLAQTSIFRMAAMAIWKHMRSPATKPQRLLC